MNANAKLNAASHFCMSLPGKRWHGIALLILGFLVGLSAGAQTLSINDAVRTYSTLSNTVVTMTGRAELRLIGTGDPMAGSVVHLNSPDAWLVLNNVRPSVAAATFLGRVRVNGVNAVLNTHE